MVHPEGFEPPAYWFVANRSIQLSYGCTRCVSPGGVTHLLKIPREHRRRNPLKLRAGRLFGCINDGRRRSGCIHQHQTGAPQQLPHDRLREARRVILDVDGACSLVEINTADAVNLANVGKCKDRAFAGRRGVPVGHINLGHKGSIPVTLQPAAFVASCVRCTLLS